MRQIIRTPMSLNVLGDQYAGFIGPAEKTHEVSGLFGDRHEQTYNYPAIMLERQHWEELGMPTSFIFMAEIDDESTN
jgi:hypothetical protein